MMKNKQADFDNKVGGLARRGYSQRDIARRLGTNRPKVRRGLARAAAHAEAAELIAPTFEVDDASAPTPDEQLELLGGLFRDAASAASELRRNGDLAAAAAHSRICGALALALARTERGAKTDEPEWPPAIVNQERVARLQQQARAKLCGYVAAVRERKAAAALASVELARGAELVRQWIARLAQLGITDGSGSLLERD